MLRMRLSELTYEILEKVVKIYDETVGGYGSHYLRPSALDYIKKEFQLGHPVEYRFGSRVTGHSKLWIQCEFFHEEGPAIYFCFGPNTDSRYEDEELAKKLGADFEKAIDSFLKKEGLAI
jgi:hypothetical protein